MSQQIHLIYENGVFRPRAEELKSLQLREGQEIEATVTTMTTTTSASLPVRGNVHKVRELVGSIPTEDIAEMQKAIDEECGRIDYDGW